MPEYSNYVETRDPIADEDVDGTELIAVSKNGDAARISVSQISGAAVTRDLARAYASELLFDYNEIEGVLHTQTDAITFTVAASGNLTDQTSIYGQRITTDGVNPIYFVGFNHLSNISSGEILDAGTYQFIFWYSNGLVRGSVMLPSEEVINLTPLSAPGSFDAVASGSTIINLTWANVTNNVGYRIDVSTDNVTFSTLITLATDSVSYSHTGLAGGSQRFYRNTALGNGITFANSPPSTDQATTTDAGDVTAPTFTFSPADAATDISVNVPLTITASEPIRDDDGVTVITSANVDDYIVLKVDNGAGADIPFTATIDAGKTIITVTPNVVYPSLDNVFVQIDGVEDVNGNESTADDATFATSDYTEMEGNYLNLDQQINAIITGNDIDFEIEAEYKDFTIVASERGLFQKYDSGTAQPSIRGFTNGTDVYFGFYWKTGTTNSIRVIKWLNALSGFSEGKLTFKYFGAIDTNNGLDRVKFFIDDVEITTGKSLSTNITVSPHTWPFAIYAGTAPFYFSGPTFREVRNFKVRNNMGATTIVDIPIIRTGTDVSGNSFDGVWI